jgi:hypothetical protein
MTNYLATKKLKSKNLNDMQHYLVGSEVPDALVGKSIAGHDLHDGK